MALNCAAIPEALQESELFGHEKGAFTGASQRRIGKFEQADGGTLFLDEVAELAAPLQAKLLRGIQERAFERVGGSSLIRSDFRLVAATHRDLGQAVREGAFREDLYFRIAVFDLQVPPLRERPGDVALLARRFVDEFGPPDPVEIAPEAIEVLVAHDWPGNVRELQNVIQRSLVVVEENVIVPQDLPVRIRPPGSPGDAGSAEDAGAEEDATPGVDGARAAEPLGAPGTADRPRTLEEIERDAILEAYRRTDGNIAEMGRQLDIGRTTLYRKLKKLELR